MAAGRWRRADPVDQSEPIERRTVNRKGSLISFRNADLERATPTLGEQGALQTFGLGTIGKEGSQLHCRQEGEVILRGAANRRPLDAARHAARSGKVLQLP